MGTRSLAEIKVSVKANAKIRNTINDGTVTQARFAASMLRELTNGVSVGNVNRAWSWKSQTISSGGNQVIDLYDFAGIDIGGGSGSDALGQTLTLEEIVLIIIKNDNLSGVAGALEIEPDSTNGWTPIGSHTVATGGALLGQGIYLKYQSDEDGFDITDASSHRIKLTANAADVKFSIFVLGRHDDEESSSSSSSVSSASSTSSSSTSSTLSSSSFSSKSESSISTSLSSSSWSSN